MLLDEVAADLEADVHRLGRRRERLAAGALEEAVPRGRGRDDSVLLHARHELPAIIPQVNEDDVIRLRSRSRDEEISASDITRNVELAAGHPVSGYGRRTRLSALDATRPPSLPRLINSSANGAVVLLRQAFVSALASHLSTENPTNPFMKTRVVAGPSIAGDVVLFLTCDSVVHLA